MSEQENTENQSIEFPNSNHQPVTVERISSILEQLGLHFELLELHPGSPTIGLPFGNGQVQVDQVDGRYVHVRSLYAAEVPTEQLPALYEVMNQWNSSQLEPTAYVAISEEVDPPVHRPVGRSTVFFPAGVSDFELAVFLQGSLTSAHEYFVKLDGLFGNLPDTAPTPDEAPDDEA